MMDLEQFTDRGLFDALKLFRGLLTEDLFRFRASKRANHVYIVYRKAINRKMFFPLTRIAAATPHSDAPRTQRSSGHVRRRRRAEERRLAKCADAVGDGSDNAEERERSHNYDAAAGFVALVTVLRCFQASLKLLSRRRLFYG